MVSGPGPSPTLHALRGSRAEARPAVEVCIGEVFPHGVDHDVCFRWEGEGDEAGVGAGVGIGIGIGVGAGFVRAVAGAKQKQPCS